MGASLGSGSSSAASNANTATANQHPAYSANSNMLDGHLLTPASIDTIELHGANNVRRSLLDGIFKSLVEGPENATSTLGEALERVGAATRKLSRFDIFKEDGFGAFISEADRPDATPDRTWLNIALSVKEKSRLVLTAGTDVGNAEGSAYTNGVFRNIFGGAETLSINASAGTRTRSAYSVNLSTPVNGNPDVRLALDALRSTTQKPWASHEEHLTGGSLKLSWLSDSKATHTVMCNGVWRQLTALAPNASPTVRADAGDSLKCSIGHSYTLDRRDNPMLPQSGYLFKSISELAGWGPLNGDVAFAKTELESAGAVPIPFPGLQGKKSGISIGAGVRVGMLYPLAKGYNLAAPAYPSRINDRFQLGGPSDVRGFKVGGLGPHDGADTVGGDVFAAGSINLLLPIPRLGAESPLRIQLFANGGRLAALQDKSVNGENGQVLATEPKKVFDGVKSAIGELGNGLPSVAGGVGLVYAHPVARFELNFSLPLVLRRGEEGRKGLQVGVGVSLL
ncbi:surface antigen-domain-containing protein [Triangularia verruculosa]|uniref:Surface antigen-domain-containing protein n=1 Tax=Triangularia verruculosa TaxID=2587418 RepID=A0AAN7AWZ5_9PEZI|nr:surface antigen-domain-containing protein [Triangularia verruculosa]